MKTMMLLLFALTSALATAENIGYEIPPSDKDVLVASGSYDHTSVYVKKITCYDQTVAVMYKTFLGYSQGSRLLGVCTLANAGSIERCQRDDSPAAIACYNFTRAFYGLDRPAATPSDFDRMQTPSEIGAGSVR